MNSEQNNFRILSLDGGGVRGVLSAQILTNIERYLNSERDENIPLGQRFDFIAGTSTGGLIALGLALGKTAQEITDFYYKHIPLIFGEANRKGWLKNLFQPKYSSDPLAAAVEEFFGTSILKDLERDVCIVSVSLQNSKPRLYKTDYFNRNLGRLDESLADIALATSAAPSYFESHSLKYSTNLIDGGVCANNPSMIALVDAFQFERASKRGSPQLEIFNDASKERTVLISVGTGEQCSIPYDHQKLARCGWLGWGANFFKVSIESQSQLIHHQVDFLLKHYLRINPKLQFPMDLDDISQIDELKNIADLTQQFEEFILAHI